MLEMGVYIKTDHFRELLRALFLPTTKVALAGLFLVVFFFVGLGEFLARLVTTTAVLVIFLRSFSVDCLGFLFDFFVVKFSRSFYI